MSRLSVVHFSFVIASNSCFKYVNIRIDIRQSKSLEVISAKSKEFSNLSKNRQISLPIVDFIAHFDFLLEKSDTWHWLDRSLNNKRYPIYNGRPSVEANDVSEKNLGSNASWFIGLNTSPAFKFLCADSISCFNSRTLYLQNVCCKAWCALLASNAN